MNFLLDGHELAGSGVEAGGQFADDGDAAEDGEDAAHRALVLDGVDEVAVKLRRCGSEQAREVAEPEQAVDVDELFGAAGGKVSR